MEAVLAIDLGATSGRAIVGYLSENKLVPKFQVEVSHPKEIHLATCSPSIF